MVKAACSWSVDVSACAATQGRRRAALMNGGISIRAPHAPAGAACAAGGGAGAGGVARARIPSLGRAIAWAPVPPSHDREMATLTGHWPLRSYLELGAY